MWGLHRPEALRLWVMLNSIPSEGIFQKMNHEGRECPGGPVVSTRRSHCRGPGVQSLGGELRAHKPCGVAKKKKSWSFFFFGRKKKEKKSDFSCQVQYWTSKKAIRQEKYFLRHTKAEGIHHQQTCTTSKSLRQKNNYTRAKCESKQRHEEPWK